MLKQAQRIHDQMIAWRRDIHMHPELGFQEKRTAALVAEELQSLGYRVRTGVGKTGVVADRGEGGPIVAIRADMDALPIQEANRVPYASQKPGIMHACGHDAHTAIALGTATLLKEEAFPGTVRFLFQPAEEVTDEAGVSGAPRMIEDGAMEGVDHVLALHVDSSLPTGTIGVEEGPVSGGVDSFYATIIGKGGHGAYPHKVVDSIYITGHVILALHGIISRRLNPFDPAVISIGSIHGGKATNVIPKQVKLSGTMRYTDPAIQEQIHREFQQALEVARALGGDFTFEIQRGYPPMHNDSATAALIRQVSSDLLGQEGLVPAKKELGAEDFGFFSQLAPGAMFGLGCRIEGDERRGHSTRFDIDEACLPIGAAILAEAALRLLS
jgi:amidohydrolase